MSRRIGPPTTECSGSRKTPDAGATLSPGDSFPPLNSCEFSYEDADSPHRSGSRKTSERRPSLSFPEFIAILCASLLAFTFPPLCSAEQLSDDQIAELEEDMLFAEGEERAELLKKLASLQDRRAQGALAKALSSDASLAPELQERIFKSLAETADSQILEEVEKLARSGSPSLRQYGLVLLGRMRDERAVDLLISAAESVANTEQMLVCIVRSLGQNGHAKAIGSLKTLAEKQPVLADEVTISRFQIGDEGAFQAYFDLYQVKADTLSDTAWDYGFRTGTPTEVRRLKQVKEALESTLLRMEEALQGIRAQSIPSLIAHVMKKENPKVYNLLFCSLPGLVRADNAERFLPLLDCPSPEVAQMALVRMDAVSRPDLRKRVDGRLLEMLEGDDVYLRRLVLENAGRFGREKGREILQRGLKDQSPWVKEKAREEVRKWRMR